MAKRIRTQAKEHPNIASPVPKAATTYPALSVRQTENTFCGLNYLIHETTLRDIICYLFPFTSKETQTLLWSDSVSSLYLSDHRPLTEK